jgi:hypothetical protein
MAATEDELAKQKVQEAVWQWTGRLIVLLVVFGFGFFAAYIMWGNGMNGAIQLRRDKDELDKQVLELKNKQVDISGQLTVVKGRLDECVGNLAKCHAGAAPAANP